MSSGLGDYRADYAASLLTSTAYGAYIVLASMSTYLLLKHGRDYRGRRITLGYTILMSVLTTIWFMAGSRASAMEFVDYAFNDNVEISCSAAFIVTKVTAVLQIFASDGALLYRTSIIWSGDKRVMTPLFLIYLVIIGLGIMAELFCVDEALFEASMTFHEATFLATILLNLLMTLAIAVRIWHSRHEFSATVSGPGSEGRMRGVLAILIESAALYSVFGIVLMPTFWHGMAVTAVISTIFQALAFLSPALIILRVAMGVSFDNNLAALRREAIFGAPLDNESMQASIVGSEKESAQEQLRGFVV